MSLERRESRQGLQTFEVHVATSSGRVVIRHQRGICCKDGSTDPKSAACGSLGSAGKHDRAGQGQLHQRGEQGSSVSDLSQRRDQCYLHTCTSSLVVSPSSEVSIGSKAPRLSLSSFQDSDHNSPRDGLRSADKTSCCAPELAPSAISYGQNQDRGEEKKWNTEPLSDVWTKYKSQKKKKKEKKKKNPHQISNHHRMISLSQWRALCDVLSVQQTKWKLRRMTGMFGNFGYVAGAEPPQPLHRQHPQSLDVWTSYRSDMEHLACISKPLIRSWFVSSLSFSVLL